MSRASLLVELQTEELPPKALKRLASAFGESIVYELRKHGFAKPDQAFRVFCTPRRIATQVSEVLDVAEDSMVEVKGPAVRAALDPQGNPTKALLGFARKVEAEVAELERVSDGKQEIFIARKRVKGPTLEFLLPAIVLVGIENLPTPKRMRWGSGDEQFVRPVHGLMMLHGNSVVPGEALGLKSGNKTTGHRFLGKHEIVVGSADEYEQKLAAEGNVIADFDKRRGEIDMQLQAVAKREAGSLGEYRDLLDEVTALVEQPSIYVGSFDASYLSVPQECLILTMRQNQKYFPLFDAQGKLLPKFLIVSNMKVADPRHIIDGNQRVVRPRLEDARFFYDQDRKTRLETRVPQLGKVVYHNKLGSQLERVQRVKLLAGKIARVLGADALQAERAAELAKADLLTGMVGEFPELQGVMGRYYALHDGEPQAVADAIAQHYYPRFAGDRVPESPIACAVALADKLDAIAGLFSIGQQPTGEKDPFGLRRAALGVVRILVENKLRLSVKELAAAAFEPFARKAATELVAFVYDRFAGYLKEQGFSTLQIDARARSISASCRSSWKR
jgi:glycyl-tRNA synthetase beta chain